METYGKFTPIINYSDDEEMMQQQELFPQQTCQHQVPLNRRKLFQKPRYQKRYLNEEETSSSSSSSSSSESSTSESSDSETEEIRTNLKRMNLRRPTKNLQQRKFETVVDLQGLRPQDVKVVVNPIHHVLIIKAKRTTIPQLGGFQGDQGKLVRIVPLPRSINLQQLRVKATTTGQLVVKAPFMFRHEQQTTTGLPTWVPIHVTYKGKNTDIFGKQQQQHKFLNFFTIPVRQTFGCNTQQQTQMPYFQDKRQHVLPNTQCIRDEVTGKLALLLNVNTVGFRPQEIRVRLNNTKNVLIVEAGQRGEEIDQWMQFPWETTTTKQFNNVTVKYLRREFVLPHTMDVNKIGYQVQRNGLLTIKLPITKHQQQILRI